MPEQRPGPSPGPTPLVSVVVPVHDAERHVAEAVGSVLGQAAPPGPDRAPLDPDDARWLQVVVVDDGSTDGTPEVLADLADPRLEVVRQANAGAAAARNTGIDRALGEWLLLVDADDRITPDAVRTFLEAAATATDVDVVVGRTERFDGHRRWEPDTHVRGLVGVPYPRSLADWPPYVRALGAANKLVRRSLLDGVRFDPGLRVAEDQPFNAALLLRARKITGAGRTTYEWRVRAAADGPSLSGELAAGRLGAVRDQLAAARRVQALVRASDLPATARVEVEAAYVDRVVQVDLAPAFGSLHRNRSATLAEALAMTADWLEDLPPAVLAGTEYVLGRMLDGFAHRYLRLSPAARSAHLALARTVLSNPGSQVALGRLDPGTRARVERLGRAARRGSPMPVQAAAVRAFATRRTRLDRVAGPDSAVRRRGAALTVTLLVPLAQRLGRPPTRGSAPEVLVASSDVRGLDENLARLATTVAARYPGWRLTVRFGPPRTAREAWELEQALDRARVVLVDDRFGPLAGHRPRAGQEVVQVWHAAAGLRRFGLADPEADEAARARERALHAPYTAVCAGSVRAVAAFAEAFGVTSDVVMPLGLPRSDALCEPGRADRVRARVATRDERLRGLRLCLYVAAANDGAGPSGPDLATLGHRLGDGWVVGYRGSGPGPGSRLVTGETEGPLARGAGPVVDLGGLTPSEALLAADHLVTDHSPLIVEYALLGRPMTVHAAVGTTDPRFFGPFPDLLPVDPVASLDHVAAQVLAGEVDRARLSAYTHTWCGALDGRSTERVLARFLGEPER